MSPDLMEALTVVATQICLGTYVMLLVEFRQPERSWRLRWIAAVTLVVAANIVLILSVGYWGVYTRLGAATVTLPYVLITLWCSSCRGMRVVFNIATALFIGCIGVVNAELARALAPSVSWLPLLVRAAAGAAMVTAAELAAGLVLNCWLGLRIWDYSREPMHLWGQICPRFSLAWYGLCLGAMLAFAGGRALAVRLRRRA